jgi:hypothetical protein
MTTAMDFGTGRGRLRALRLECHRWLSDSASDSPSETQEARFDP